MKKLILLALVFACSIAHAQNVRWDLGAPGSAGAVTTAAGSYLVALGNVQLAWCTYPANAVPCTNYANTYPTSSSSSACPTNAQIVLQGSVTCQGTSDNFGNLGVWTSYGTFAFTLTLNGVSYGPFTVTLGQGGANPGTFSSSAWTHYLTSQVGPNSAQAIASIPGGTVNGFTDALEGILTAPNGVTTGTVNAVAGFGLNLAGAGANVVGGYFSTVCQSASSNCWGTNPNVADVLGFPAHFLFAGEFDVVVQNAASSGAGLLFNGTFLAQPTLMPAIHILKPNGGASTGTWAPQAIAVDDGASSSGTAMLIGSFATGNSQPGALYGSRGRDGGGVTHTASWQADLIGNFLVTPASGLSFLVHGHYGTDAANKDVAGTCAIGTNCAISFNTNYASTPACVANDSTAANAVKVVTSTSGVTFSGTNGDAVVYFCFGLPN